MEHFISSLYLQAFGLSKWLFQHIIYVAQRKYHPFLFSHYNKVSKTHELKKAVVKRKLKTQYISHYVMKMCIDPLAYVVHTKSKRVKCLLI